MSAVAVGQENSTPLEVTTGDGVVLSTHAIEGEADRDAAPSAGNP
jgi:hypothetical protein